MIKKQHNNKISVEEFALMGVIKSRRNKPVTSSYLYRLIRQHSKGERSALPFNYTMEGDKDRIYILLN